MPMDGMLMFEAIIGIEENSLGADGNSGRPFLTQTGQRSGELTANYG